MSSQDIERRLAAILSADAVGYSRLMAEDEQGTIRTLTAYREAITGLVEQHRGRVVDSPGDNVLAEFPTALDAVECAVEIQRALKAKNEGLAEDRRMELRIGVHMGDVAVQQGRLYGHGVNIAARLEGLADPGGICISAEVYGQVENKLDVGFADLGAQSVKNIAKPVGVYRLLSDRATKPVKRGRSKLKTAALHTSLLLGVVGLLIWLTWPGPLGILVDLAGIGGPPVNPPLPDRPSIVILPFTNLSGDPDQEYFADGLTEELTASLARIPEIFVIARNSAFAYKGLSTDVRDISLELGVQYVLEGSAVRSGDRVRVTAQLIDALSGYHLWSEKYDRDLDDLLTLQTEISREILDSLRVEIREAELERTLAPRRWDPDAYDAFDQGQFHFDRHTRADYLRARELFQRAIEIEPGFGAAHALLGISYINEFAMGWNRDPTLVQRGKELSQRAQSLDPSDPMGYTGVANALMQEGRFDEAIQTAQRAVELAPNIDVPHFILGFALARKGRFVAALPPIQRALRLNPKAPSPFWMMVAYVNLGIGRDEEAIELMERVRASNPDQIIARLVLAAVYGRDGQDGLSRKLVTETLSINPELTLDDAMQLLVPGNEGVLLRADTRETLRRAGLS